jgi:6-phosphogluconolactonase
MATASDEWCVCADPQALAEEAVERVLASASRATAERGAFRVALAGGRTPERAYELLAKCSSDAAFERWQVFFGDERMVPQDHAESNFRMAWQALLHKVEVPTRNVYRWRTELGDPARVAQAYARDLAAAFAQSWVGGTDHGWPRFDLILLGLGRDGHVASLFPRTAALDERGTLAVANWVPKLESWRLTLTYPVIEAAREVLFLVAGGDKAEAVRNVRAERGDEREWPARKVRPTAGALAWLLDREAAAGLEA